MVGVSLCYYFYFEGLYYSSAFNAGLIEATIPLVTLALSVLLKEEHLDSAQTTGFALAYVGVLVIVTRLDWAVIQAFAYNRGDVLLLLGTLCFGLYNVLLRKFPEFEEMQNQVIYVSATPADYELEKSGGIYTEQIIRPTGLLDPIIEVRPTMNQIDDLIEEIQKRVEEDERVLVTTLTKKMAEV